MTDDCGHGLRGEIASWLAAGCELVLFVDALGREHLRYECPHCHKFSNAIRFTLGKDQLRVVASHHDLYTYGPCAVDGCESEADERHHFAPRAVFGLDGCDRWPTAALCHAHHDEWHEKMAGYSRYRAAL